MQKTELIFHRGLNCHLACVVNIAAALGINYTDAFCSLWSETDFDFLDEYNILISKRAAANLRRTGVCMQTVRHDSDRIKTLLSETKAGGFLIVGMDIFNIPWHHVYNFFHGSHYFFIKKISDSYVLCYDPVYHESGIKLDINHIGARAFELSRVSKGKASQKESHTLHKEANAVKTSHPKILKEISSQIMSCKNDDNKKINFINRQITAMQNNRYLFSEYLSNLNKISKTNILFEDNLLREWEALRNGLIKAVVVKNKLPVLDEANKIFTSIINTELDFADKILSRI